MRSHATTPEDDSHAGPVRPVREDAARSQTARWRQQPGFEVLIGLIDYGFDILHPALLASADPEAGPGSQFVALFDQNRRAGDQFKSARLERLGSRALNDLVRQALQTGSRAQADAIYDPHKNYYDPSFVAGGGKGGAHGTLMASIAAQACQRRCGLIGVQLALHDHHWKEQTLFGLPTWANWLPDDQPVWSGWRSYPEQPHIADAIETAWQEARRRAAAALVINLSLGAFAGAHDGRSTVERQIASVRERSSSGEGPATAIVLAAGNAGNADGHFTTTLQASTTQTLTWAICASAERQSKLEIWYEAQAPEAPPLEVRVLAAHAAGAWPIAPGPISPGPTASLELGGHRIGIADHVTSASGKLSRIRCVLHPPYFPHPWAMCCSRDVEFVIELTAPPGALPIEVHAWLEREDHPSCRASLSPATSEGTLSGLCGGEGAIIVGAQDTTPATLQDEAHSDRSLTAYAPSGAGPQPWRCGPTGRAPHVCAPGHRVMGAWSKTPGFVATSGSSPAAATVSGALARALSDIAAECANAGVSRAQTRACLEEAIERAARPRQGTWHPKLGFGPASFERTPTVRLDIKELAP